MKKYIGFLIVLSILVFGASKAQAVSMSDLQKQIQSLSEQVSLLKDQLVGAVASSLTAQTATTSNVAVSDAVIIQKGTTSTEVSIIQSALKAKGYFTGNVTSYYGDVTAKAVSSYQKVNSLPVTGIVDSATKNSILKSTPPIPVVKPISNYQVITFPFTRLENGSAVVANMVCPQGTKVLTTGYGLTYSNIVNSEPTFLSSNVPQTGSNGWSLGFLDPQHRIGTQDDDPTSYSKGYIVCATLE